MMLNQRRSPNVQFQILSRIPPSLYHFSGHMPLLVPFYHLISDEVIDHTKHLFRHKTINEFKKDLDFLLAVYHPITLGEVLDCRRAERPLPEKRFLLTFDDGYGEMSDIVAPILLAKGVNATFFLNSAFVDNKAMCHANKASVLVERLQHGQSPSTEGKLLGLLRSHNMRNEDLASTILSIPYERRALLDEMGAVLDVDFSAYLSERQPYLTSPQVQQLIASGFTIGGHSLDHPMYPSLPLREQLRQAVESVRFVRERFEVTYGAFAFPFEDDGVPRHFFDRLSRIGGVDVTFGAAGMIDDGIPNHFQRVCMELHGAQAKHILAYHHARRMVKALQGSERINSPVPG